MRFGARKFGAQRAAPRSLLLTLAGYIVVGTPRLLPSALDPSSWSRCRGPIDAANLSLRRFGWKWLTAFQFQCDRGLTINICELAPRLLRRMLRESPQRQHENLLASKIFPANVATSRGAWTEPAEGFLRSKRLSGIDRCIASAVVCDGVWTKCKASSYGYGL